jgi:hypothetical protein
MTMTLSAARKLVTALQSAAGMVTKPVVARFSE